jgi:hypothetical protein
MSRVRTGALILATLLIGLLGCDGSTGPKDLIGTWEGTGGEMGPVLVSFAPDGGFHLEYVDAKGERKKLTGDYEADFTKTPVPLSIRRIKELPHPLHTIVQFEGADTLRMGSFAPRWRLRPLGFNPDSEILLERRLADARTTS